jgi:hypothetical protein
MCFCARHETSGELICADPRRNAEVDTEGLIVCGRGIVKMTWDEIVAPSGLHSGIVVGEVRRTARPAPPREAFHNKMGPKVSRVFDA